MSLKMEKSHGNVFLDLGFSKEEAANLLVRSRLMVEVKCHIEREKLTQAQASKLLASRNPESAILNAGR